MPKLRNVPSSNVEDRREDKHPDIEFVFRNSKADFSTRLPFAVPEDAGSRLSEEAGFSSVGKTPLMSPATPPGISSLLFNEMPKLGTEKHERMLDLINRKGNGS
jgi:hypothetical protein